MQLSVPLNQSVTDKLSGSNAFKRSRVRSSLVLHRPGRSSLDMPLSATNGGEKAKGSRAVRFEEPEVLTAGMLRQEFLEFERRLLPKLQKLMTEGQHGKLTAQEPSTIRNSGRLPAERMEDSKMWHQEAQPQAPKQEERSSRHEKPHELEAAATPLTFDSLEQDNSILCSPLLPMNDDEDELRVRSSGNYLPLLHQGDDEARPTRESSANSVRQTRYTVNSRYQTLEEDDHHDEMPLSDASTPQEFTAACVLHPMFNLVVSLMIAMNSVQIGCEVDFSARNPGLKLPRYCKFLDVAFCCFFVTEISLRLFAHRGDFLRMPGWQWNAFDSLVVSLQVIDSVPSFSLLTGRHEWDLSVVRIFRMVRIIRILRVMRLLNRVEHLRMLVVTIGGSLGTLGWVLLLLFLVLYAFSVFITLLVTGEVQEVVTPKDPKNIEAMHSMFGSLLATMLTLYQAACGGISWRDAVHPMQAESSSTIVPFVFSLYIAIMVFALLNVVTGVVLTCSVKAAEEDRQMAVIEQMRQFFKEADKDRVGSIGDEEMDLYLYEPGLQTVLQSIDLSLDDARQLFILLADVSSDRRVLPDDFIEACLRWSAPTKKIEYAFLQSEISLMSKELLYEISSLNQTVPQSQA